ncbi:hypothetical protein SLA2020_059350 [Shorea laevis]
MVPSVFVLHERCCGRHGIALKGVKAATEGVKDPVKTNDPSSLVSSTHPGLFEGNFTDLKKWVDVKSFFRYGTLFVLQER